ncbi:hypothetical protein DEJ56_14220 [Bacillus altitudinis]|nr:hypothetical protein DEJ56_14220 [Bacillus altitudinis]
MLVRWSNGAKQRNDSHTKKEGCLLSLLQRADKPSHSLSGLCAGAHECNIRSAPVLALPRLQRFSCHAERKTKG